MNPIKQLLVWVLSAVSLHATAQVNAYFDNNPVWQVHSSCMVPVPCLQDEDYNYYVSGDTVINGLDYKLLYRKGLGIRTWMAPPPVGPGCTGSYSYITPTPECYLRSATGRMYIRQPSDTGEHLLYDFNLAAGDTLPLTFNNNEPLITVSGIDSLYTPYGYRKKFMLSGNTWATFLIEGIGHDRGFLEPLHIPFECGFDLTCFSLNDTAWFPSTGPTCNLNVGLHEPAAGLFNATVSPNPFTSQAEIRWNSLHTDANLSVRSAHGKLVLDEKNLEGNRYLFSGSGLSPGCYFYRVWNESGTIGAGALLLAD